MNKKVILIIVILFAMLLISCTLDSPDEPGLPDTSASEDTSDPIYQKISAEDLKAKMDSGDDIIIIDVRKLDEFEAGHIKGAINIPYRTISSEPPEELDDIDAEIIVYCLTGGQSIQAAKRLINMGYTNVYDLGGLSNWPYEIVSSSD